MMQDKSIFQPGYVIASDAGVSPQTRSYAPAAAVTGAHVAPSTNKVRGATPSRPRYGLVYVARCFGFGTFAFAKDRASSPHDGLLRDIPASLYSILILKIRVQIKKGGK